MNAAISSSTRVSANAIEACCESAPQVGYPAHQPDSNLVRGILFVSTPFRTNPVPGIADVTASVRQVLGAPPVADGAGKPLW